jgi:hypothetical protein
MTDRRATAIAIGVALSAAVMRLVPLGWLHPLNWDEIEFYRATRWIAEGLVPYRDFWEHHSPLGWFLFAPFSLLSDSPGVSAILSMRWAQIPVWIATFWLANVFMRNAGLSRFARWAAMALALSSSFLMISAVEYRVDPLACALYIGALVLVQRNTSRAMFGAGVMFCLVGLANVRFGPLLVFTVLFLRFVDLRNRSWRTAWRVNHPANWMFAGGFAGLVLPAIYLAATKSFGSLWQQVIYENYLGDKYAKEIVGQFFHRIIVVFGVRVMGFDQIFDPAAIDVGGIALLVAGFAGLFLVVRRSWRAPDALFAIAVLQVVNLLVIGGMRFVYNYHFQLPVILMLPLVAVAIEKIPRRGAVFAILVMAWSVNAFASFFRGKELDLAYQDFIMRSVHARTHSDEKVWAGMGWALRREPTYHFWFLPALARVLVEHGHAAPLQLNDLLRDPPAIVVFDHSAKVWVTIVQRNLAPFFVRYYVPVWRNLWIPGMNIRLRPGLSRFQWAVPRDGPYRLYATTALAKHMWFRDPIYVGSYEAENVSRTELFVGAPAENPALHWRVDGAPIRIPGRIFLRKGQLLEVAYDGAEPLGVILLSGDDTTLFRQPPPDANLEASTSRVTHIPQFGAHLE